MAKTNGYYSILLLLDLSTTFDTVDYPLLKKKTFTPLFSVIVLLVGFHLIYLTARSVSHLLLPSSFFCQGFIVQTHLHIKSLCSNFGGT